MIKKLRRRFILIAMGSFVLVVAIIIGAINTVNMMQIDSQTTGILQLIAANNGEVPFIEQKHSDKSFGIDLTEETRFQTRYFTVFYNEDWSLKSINTGHIAAISSETAAELARQALEKGKETAYNGIYKYIIDDDGKCVIFVDCRAQLDQSQSFLLASCTIAIIGLFFVFLLILMLSKKAIRPFVESLQKQKRFITDAGHEIKTPLAIISANADVLEMTGGDNEWVRSIKNQTVRLNGLVQSLLTLSKASETDSKPVFVPFSLSDAVRETATEFITLASTKNKALTLNIAENISYTGDEKGIRELVSVLCDNGVKYANDGGAVDIRLYEKGKKTVLEVYNTVEHINKEALPHLFDRFYRNDEARGRENGGFGIGLSVAAEVARVHKAKIYAKTDDEKSVSFIVIF